jgi:hypothetical protein
MALIAVAIADRLPEVCVVAREKNTVVSLSGGAGWLNAAILLAKSHFCNSNCGSGALRSGETGQKLGMSHQHLEYQPMWSLGGPQ